jgi:hypothetical protein
MRVEKLQSGGMMRFEYPAVLNVQTEGGQRLVTFAAPAADIGEWGGVPQKKRFEDGEETAGFQREDNQGRIRNLATFLADPRNTLQNPLLCSDRGAEGCSVTFVPTEDWSTLGHVVIEMPSLAKLPLIEVFERVQRYLESRVPSLVGRPVPEPLVARLQLLARGSGLTPEPTDEDQELSEDEGEPSSVLEDDGVQESGSTAVLFEESHISDFWDDLAARRTILAKVGGDFEGDSFLGFSRDALESYIRPVVIMDGQHRLLGALEAARRNLDKPEMMDAAERRIEAGETGDEVAKDLLRQSSRRLPVSMLMDPNPAEHVFQFIVVNQKATPIGRALLGTIVSTSLSNDELETVADRLRRADIPLEESRAASFMARNDRSPFKGKVELGVGGGKTGNRNELLAWPVMVSLVQMFRELKGGALYHQRSNDYAKAWADNFLDSSPIVEGFREKGFDSAKEYWGSFDGPWRDVFIVFWNHVAAFFGDMDEPTVWNYWGNPRTSNLFNKISLNILAADFFRYMRSRKIRLASSEEVEEVCKAWLGEVDHRYFARDWKLDRVGVKKDTPGMRAAWARTWTEYLDSPDRLPRIEKLNTPAL